MRPPRSERRSLGEAVVRSMPSKTILSTLTRAYLKQICVDGIWHSDPHPGNVFVRDLEDNQAEVVLLDFGMVSRISHEFQDEIIKMLLAISSNRGAEVGLGAGMLAGQEPDLAMAQLMRRTWAGFARNGMDALPSRSLEFGE